MATYEHAVPLLNVEHMSQPDGLFSSVVVLLEKVNAADTSIPPGLTAYRLG